MISSKLFIKNGLLFFIILLACWPTYLSIRMLGVVINPHRLLVVVLGILFCLEILYSGRFNFVKNIVEKRFFWLIILYFIVRIVSAVLSKNIMTSFGVVSNDIIFMLIPFFIICKYFNSENDFNKIINTIIYASLFVMFVGLLETFFQENVFFKVFPRQMFDDDLVQVAAIEKIRGMYRIQSTFSHPLVFAQFLIIIIPLFSLKIVKTRRYFVKFIYIALITISLFLIYNTDSRAALLIIILYSLVLVYLKTRLFFKNNSFLSLILVAVVVIVFTVFAYIASSNIDNILPSSGDLNEKTMSAIGRLVQIMNGIELIKNNFMIGVGPKMSLEMIGTLNKFGQYSVDNYYLTLFADSGVFAFLIFVYLNFLAAKKIIIYNNVSPIIYSVSLSAFGSAIFMFFLSIPHQLSIIFIIFGIIISRNIFDNKTKKFSEGSEKLSASS